MKLENIQGMRALAVILVLLSHMFRIEEKYSPDQIMPSFFLGGISGVDLFFVISGFIMVVTTYGDFGSSKNGLKFLYKRSTRIFPLYWLYSLLVLIVALVVPAWVNSGASYSLISSFLLLPSSEGLLLGVGWTLVHEMYFYYVFFIFLLFSQRMLGPLLITWSLFIVIANAFFEIATPVSKLIFSPLTFEFILGAALGLWFKVKPESTKKLGKTLSIVFIFISFTLMLLLFDIFYKIEGVLPQGGWRVIIFGIPATLIIYCAVSLEGHGVRFPAWLAKIGDASYSTYLSHVLVLSVLGRFWVYFATDVTPVDNIIALIVLALACLFYGWLSYVMFEKPLLKFSRKLYSALRRT